MIFTMFIFHVFKFLTCVNCDIGVSPLGPRLCYDMCVNRFRCQMYKFASEDLHCQVTNTKPGKQYMVYTIHRNKKYHRLDGCKNLARIVQSKSGKDICAAERKHDDLNTTKKRFLFVGHVDSKTFIIDPKTQIIHEDEYKLPAEVIPVTFIAYIESRNAVVVSKYPIKKLFICPLAVGSCTVLRTFPETFVIRILMDNENDIMIYSPNRSAFALIDVKNDISIDYKILNAKAGSKRQCLSFLPKERLIFFKYQVKRNSFLSSVDYNGEDLRHICRANFIKAATADALSNDLYISENNSIKKLSFVSNYTQPVTIFSNIRTYYLVADNGWLYFFSRLGKDHRNFVMINVPNNTSASLHLQLWAGDIKFCILS